MHSSHDNALSRSIDKPDNGLLEYRSEDDAYQQRLSPWQILVVDDDHDFQRATAFAMSDIKIFGRPLKLTQAYSMAEASSVLAEKQDFGVVLLDVVMESDHAGLRLVKAIREILGNAEIRIALITGQPGIAPMRDVMNDYDINEYCTKSELSTSRLISILTAELRTFDQLKTISTAKRGLQLIVESSNHLLNKHELTTYCDAALTAISLLLGLNPEGVVCVKVNQNNTKKRNAEPIDQIMIVGAAGKLRSLIGKSIDHLPDIAISESLDRAIKTRSNIEQREATILFFPKEQSGADFAIYLSTSRNLLDTERQLLYVFASNISGGLHNVALFSRLDHLAYFDDFLKIPNQNALMRAIDRELSSKGRSRLVLLIVDLDDFSRINHTFGIAYGDSLLRQFSKRLRDLFLAPTIVARINDDVFGILGALETVSATAVGSTLVDPFDIHGTSHKMSACIASVYLGSVEGNARDAIRQGRLALKEAKRQGPGSTLIYNKNLESSSIQCFQILHKLQQALAEQQLFLVYQPQIELSSGAVVGVEALVRWNNKGTFIPPDLFIPIAEASTLIHNLGFIVLKEVCDAITAVKAAGLTTPVFSVNVSGKQFSNAALIPSILEMLRKNDIAPYSIELEVTETAMMQSFEEVSAALREFRNAGGTVAIDDFGTGYSSLKYLKELPADTLKIDRAFVSEIEADKSSGSIAAMVIRLARSLGMQVIAEGVETEEQARWLSQYQCDHGQGWHYCRPMPLAALIEWLRGQSVKTGL